MTVSMANMLNHLAIVQTGGGWGDEPKAGSGWSPDQETGSSRYEGSQSSSGTRRGQVSQKKAAATESMQSLAPPPASSIKVIPDPSMAGMLACFTWYTVACACRLCLHCTQTNFAQCGRPQDHLERQHTQQHTWPQ